MLHASFLTNMIVKPHAESEQDLTPRRDERSRRAGTRPHAQNRTRPHAQNRTRPHAQNRKRPHAPEQDETPRRAGTRPHAEPGHEITPGRDERSRRDGTKDNAETGRDPDAKQGRDHAEQRRDVTPRVTLTPSRDKDKPPPPLLVLLSPPCSERRTGGWIGLCIVSANGENGPVSSFS